jgi:hypothetical protein
VTRERFQELAEAYGGDVARWPADVREEAALLATAEPGFVGVVLAREARLDATLAELPRPATRAELFETIVASAPPLKAERRWRLWLAPAGLGAALAGIAAAGVVLGVQLSERSTASTEMAPQSVADLDVSAVSEVG